MYSKYPRIDKAINRAVPRRIDCYNLLHRRLCAANDFETMVKKQAKKNSNGGWICSDGDFFVEIQRHNIKEQDIINVALLKISRKNRMYL